MKNASKHNNKGRIHRNNTNVLDSLNNLRQFVQDQVDLNNEIRKRGSSSSSPKKKSHQNFNKHKNDTHHEISQTSQQKKLNNKYFNNRIDPISSIDTRYPISPEPQYDYTYSTKVRTNPETKIYKTPKDQTISEISSVISPANIDLKSRKKTKSRIFKKMYKDNSKLTQINPLFIETFDDFYEYDQRQKSREQDFTDFKNFQLKSFFFDLWLNKWTRSQVKSLKIDLEYFKLLDETLKRKEQITPEEAVRREINRLRKKRDKIKQNDFLKFNTSNFNDLYDSTDSSQIIRFVQSQSSLDSEVDVDKEFLTPPIYDSQNESDGPPLFFRNRLSHYQMKFGKNNKNDDKSDPPLFFEDSSENERFFAALNCQANILEKDNNQSTQKATNNVANQDLKTIENEKENNLNHQNEIKQEDNQIFKNDSETHHSSSKESDKKVDSDENNSKSAKMNYGSKQEIENDQKFDQLEEEEEEIEDEIKNSKSNENIETKNEEESSKSNIETKNEVKSSKSNENIETKNEEESSKSNKNIETKNEEESLKSNKNIGTLNEEESVKSNEEKSSFFNSDDFEKSSEKSVNKSEGNNSNENSEKAEVKNKVKNSSSSSDKSGKSSEKAHSPSSRHNAVKIKVRSKNNNEEESTRSSQTEASKHKSGKSKENSEQKSDKSNLTENSEIEKINCSKSEKSNSSEKSNHSKKSGKENSFEITEKVDNKKEKQSSLGNSDRSQNSQKSKKSSNTKSDKSDSAKNSGKSQKSRDNSESSFLIDGSDKSANKEHSLRDVSSKSTSKSDLLIKLPSSSEDFFLNDYENNRQNSSLNSGNQKNLLSKHKINDISSQIINSDEIADESQPFDEISEINVESVELSSPSNEQILSLLEEDMNENNEEKINDQKSLKNIKNAKFNKEINSNKEGIIRKDHEYHSGKYFHEFSFFEEEEEADAIDIRKSESSVKNKSNKEDYSLLEEEEEENESFHNYEFDNSEKLFPPGHRIIHNSNEPIFTSLIDEKNYKEKQKIKPLSKEESRKIFGRLVDFYDSDDSYDQDISDNDRKDTFWSRRFDSSSTDKTLEIFEIPSQRGRIRHSSSDDTIVLHITDPEFDGY